jgi:hypothetical protein
MTLLPMGVTGNFCVLTEVDGVSLLASNAAHCFDESPVDGGVTLQLSVAEALALGQALIQAARARSN